MDNRYDMGHVDSVGARFSLIWRREDGAHVVVDDGYERRTATVMLDEKALLRLAATIIVGLAPTDEHVSRIIAALTPLDAPLLRPLEDPNDPETWGGDPAQWPLWRHS